MDYVESARVGHSGDPWFQNVAGVVEAGGEVFIYDAGHAKVFRLTDRLEVLSEFGRPGEGPGELQASAGPIAVDGGSRRWISASDSSVLVFDGARLHEFTQTGDFVEVWPAAVANAGLNRLSSRIEWTQGAIVVGSGGRNPLSIAAMSGTNPIYSVGPMNRAGELQSLIDIELPPAPRFNGAPYVGTLEARPIWDVEEGCVVVSDGHNPWLLVVDSDGVDTLHFSLAGFPEATQDARDEANLMGRQGNAPSPVARARIRDILIDPAGMVWVEPLLGPARPGVEVPVIRIPLGGGVVSVDTVPAFPRAFSADGAYYASVRDEFGQWAVVRYDPVNR